MNSQLRTPSNPGALLAAGIDLSLEPTEAEMHAKHVALREASALLSDYELYCWKLLSNLSPKERECPHLPTLDYYKGFIWKGVPHA